MKRAVVFEAWPDGPRCYVRTPFCRFRVHHGLVGVVLALIGVALMAHDAADRYWLHD